MLMSMDHRVIGLLIALVIIIISVILIVIKYKKRDKNKYIDKK